MCWRSFFQCLTRKKKKNNLLLFKVTVAKEEKNASAITRILQIRTTTEKNELTGLVLCKKKSYIKKSWHTGKVGPETLDPVPLVVNWDRAPLNWDPRPGTLILSSQTRAPGWDAEPRWDPEPRIPKFLSGIRDSELLKSDFNE